MDQTGSEESKQPAGEGAKPSEPSTGEHRASSEHSGQGDSPESARRAFDLLERFSGELEEILQSLERARGGSAPGEESPPAPERAYRPSSIHFDSSPISTRIDPNALPPVESPGATSRTAPRLLLEALFLILVAAISARTGLRPLLIVTAEAVAFLIVASIELAVAHERRRIQQLPAATPSFAAPEAQEAETTSSFTALTLEQVEPLVWLSELREAAAEADWPLAVNELPSEAEDTEGAQEGATEIASERRGEVAAAPEPVPEAQPEADLEDAVSPPISEPEAATDLESTAEIPAPEAELEPEPEVAEAEIEAGLEPEVAEAEIEAGLEPEVAAEPEIEPERESIPEVFVAEAEPEQPRRFHLFRRTSEAAADAAAEAEDSLESGAETPAPETEVEFEAKTEAEPVGAESELEVEPEAVSEPETELEAEPEHAQHFHLFRRETSEPETADAEIDAELSELAAEPEIEDEPEAVPEAVSEPETEPEAEPEQPRRFHLFRHEASEPEVEPEPEVSLESTVEIPTSEVEMQSRAEIAPEFVLEPEIESESEAEPEQPRRFHLFRHEEKVLEAELEPEAKAEPEVEPVAEVEGPPEIAPEAEPEQPHRFHLFRHEEKVLEAEMELEAEAKEEIEPAEMTIEIDLPPETALDEIERTLEDIGRREPSLRRRRWSRGAEAEKAVAVQTLEDETANGESEVRLTAERERRRREREYLRNLRVSR